VALTALVAVCSRARPPMVPVRVAVPVSIVAALRFAQVAAALAARMLAAVKLVAVGLAAAGPVLGWMAVLIAVPAQGKLGTAMAIVEGPAAVGPAAVSVRAVVLSPVAMRH